MSFVALALLAVCVMAGACWASNSLPGRRNWRRAALARLAWWGAPFGVVVWVNGAPPDHAVILAGAAWLGAWVPHVPMPDVHEHWTAVIGDALIVMLRVVAVLAGPAAVFWLCGAFWPAMIFAAASASLCMQMAIALPRGWPGLRDDHQVAGVLFGACVGFWLAVAVWTPTPAPDLLP